MARNIRFGCLLLWAAAACMANETYGLEQSVAQHIRRLKSSNAELRQSAIDALSATFLTISALPSESGELTKLRKEALPLLPELITLLKHRDEEVAETAMRVIAALESEARAATDTLKEIIQDNQLSPAIRWQAAHALLCVTPETEAVTPFLLEVVASMPRLRERQTLSDDELRLMSVGLLVPAVAEPLLSSGHTNVEIPHLLQATTPAYPGDVRAFVIAILAEFGPDATEAVPTLRTLLQSQDHIVQACAADAILRIERDPDVMPELAVRLGLHDETLREFEQAAQALFDGRSEISETFREALVEKEAFILALLRSQLKARGPIRRETLRLIADVGPAANATAPDVRKLLDDRDAETRQLAAGALRRLTAARGAARADTPPR